MKRNTPAVFKGPLDDCNHGHELADALPAVRYSLIRVEICRKYSILLCTPRHSVGENNGPQVRDVGKQAYILKMNSAGVVGRWGVFCSPKVRTKERTSRLDNKRKQTHRRATCRTRTHGGTPLTPRLSASDALPRSSQRPPSPARSLTLHIRLRPIAR